MESCNQCGGSKLYNMMNGSYRKRKEATPEKPQGSNEPEDPEFSGPSPKKPRLNDTGKNMELDQAAITSSSQPESSTQQLTPLKLTWKKKGKRDIEQSEMVQESEPDGEINEGRRESYVSGGMTSIVGGRSDPTQSWSEPVGWPMNGRLFTETSRLPNMAANLRGSLRGSNGQVGAKQVKKLLVKTPLEAPKIPENFQEDTWAKLKTAVASIHQRKPVDYSLEELYAGVEGLLTYNYTTSIYDKLEVDIKHHLVGELRALENDTNSLPDSAFLLHLNKIWQDHCDHTLLIRSIFLSLDRRIAADETSTRAIWEMGLALFREVIAEVSKIEMRMKRGLLAAIEADRNSQAVDRSLIKNVSRIYQSLGMYQEYFEPQFLKETENYYSAESEAATESMTLENYLIYVDKRLDFENDTINLYLSKNTIGPLRRKLLEVLLMNHLPFIISKGFEELLDKDRHEDLKRIYRLVGLVDAHKALRQAWNQYIKRKGSELVNDKSKDKTMVEELLAFRARLDQILVACFARDSEFAYSLKEGFESAVNSRLNTPSEMLAKFLDRHLQSGNRATTSDSDFEALFEKVMSIFRSLNSKDVFEAFYRKDLAKRLLLQKSASLDAEKMGLSHLKDECGGQYTSKMEGMFKDIDLSKNITGRYVEHLTENPEVLINSKTDVGIHVLTTGYWPSFTPLELNLPVELAAIHQSFAKFYLKQFHARNLVWLNSHGHVTMRAAFPRGRRELSVSTVQATVLLLFNDASSLSYQDIKAACGIKDDDELKRTILSLFAGKFKLLVRKGDKASAPSTPNAEEASNSMAVDKPAAAENPDAMAVDKPAAGEKTDKEIAPTDEFIFNAKFTSKKVRIKINQIQLKETRVEQQKTQEAVFQDRQGQVDAAIVRIMKTRKSLAHNDLIAEVIHILKFPFQASDLKKRIESLIEREFIARDKADNALYHYLA